MDERRASPRRRGTGVGLLTTIGLGALGLATLAAAALAGAGLEDDPLGAVATSRLVPELVVSAVVVTALIGLTLWVLVPAAPTSRSPTSARASLWPRVAGTVAGFALLGLLVVLVHRLDAGTESESTSEAVPAERQPDPADGAVSSGARDSPVARLAIAIGGVGAVLLLSAAAVRAVLSYRPLSETSPDHDPGVTPGRERRGARTLAAELETIDRRLAAEDDPRLAVIESYWSLEQAMTSAGFPPSPTETSSEFLARCLEPLGPGADAARRLTQLFEWAMFSRRPIDEATRADAVRALRDAIVALDALDALDADPHRSVLRR